ncbi:DUF3348 family protein [Thauera phenolivorans]|uniref:DUF3348 family protein n=1 Tax=Thauera phenolivorans TaxID=1792543 RepID=UPI00083B6943|nr:DUF3348 family protein [Thauera phenolivorans]
MVEGLQRTRLDSSRLVRALVELAVTDGPEPKQSFAERLGQWLDLKDALALFSALNPGAVQAHAQGGGTPASPASAAARKAYARVLAGLSAAIAAEPLLSAAPPPALEAGFAPYQRCHLAHQRAMIAAIGPLRATVRATVAKRSPALARLAALDAVLEQALAARERSLLATLPALLAARFEQLGTAARVAQPTAPEGATTGDAADWLAGFRKDMQAVLQAELDLRLQPVAGLIEALDNDTKG